MNKKISIIGLMIINSLILLSGIFFIVYSLYFRVNIKVLNTQVTGAIFGALVLYFGIRYFMNLLKLRKEVFTSNNNFSWSNFKWEKRGK